MGINNNKFLSIKGTVLDKEQLQTYMEKSAMNAEISNESSTITYPIPRLNENFKFIEKTYNLLNEHIKKNIDIYPAGEWLLDNFYIIEETVKKITREMSVKKYKNFPGIASGIYKGFSRIYVLASEIVAYTENKINDEILTLAVLAYQRKKTLSMEEIWNLWLFLEVALIENIRGVCEKIYSSHMQKYKVESIVERLIEKKEKQEFKPIKDEYKSQMSYKEIKYPFIEYMSYKLKKYGKQGIAYLNILEEQVDKMGLTISDAIKKEHFDIAIQKVLIGNGITSIREINRINFLNLFEEINGVEELLKKDPANVYEKMDYKTKEYYRNKIKSLSKKTKLSEIYIAKKTLELANKADGNKKKHIGYYLMDKGQNQLAVALGAKPKYRNEKPYIVYMYLLPIILSYLFGVVVYNISNLWIAVITAIFSYIPISEMCIQILNYALGKVVKPKLIPKLDFSEGIPEKYSTIVVIPTILSHPDKVKELAHNLEVYYLANKSENLYFAILGDCTSSNIKDEEKDSKIIEIGLEEINKLNEKYKLIENDKDKFYFLYRERTWNSSEKCYLGWERKRGLLCQFNEFLVTGKNNFRTNTIKGKLPIRYVITLDADTNLVLDTAQLLVGSMAHILNVPVIDENKNIVVEGHGLIQPRVGIDLAASRKSLFTKIYAGSGGTDSYTNAISDIYQDNFGEGIFTGKGIYDLNVFYKVLNDEFPENTVLSHDLLEGSYLRCGLASDILLMDGYPAKYNSYIQRLHRWIRGDFQIIGWLKGTIKIKNGTTRKNPLSRLSKLKIFDNLRRSVVPISTILLLILGLVLSFKYKALGISIFVLSIIAYTIPTILDTLNYIIFKEEIKPNFISAYKNMTKTIAGIKASILRGILNFLFLPHQAYIACNAICKTIYRMKISKQNLLEWMTAEEAEKQAKSSLISYYKNMPANIVFSILLLPLGTGHFGNFCGILWIIAPYIAWYISKEYKNEGNKLDKKQKEYILEIGQKTWKFFEENINEVNNFLPPDNYQEDRKEQVAHRTSPTNIGLGLLAICSAYDLKYINLDKCLELLENSLNTIAKLPKWNGHLYNWYNTKNLEPLYPRYISTVDSGNFIGYLYTLKQFLIKHDKTNFMLQIIEGLIDNTNFAVLYDYKKRLFSIGFNVEENKLTDSYYDLLASEARQASLVAIAKRDISAKHWNSLSRTLTSLNRYKGLISWSGTAFEYLMPNVNIKRYEGSLLDESCKFMIMSQQEYSKKLGIPWGISEAAFNLKDLNNNYQYKAFGIPWLGLKRGLDEDMVVSPYSIFLSMAYNPTVAIENLKRLESNMYDKYGFYESIDYTISRLKYGKTSAPVKTYMAHHQGLILLSINNIINNDILVKRFCDNPEIESIDILLQERMPEKAIITKEKKEKVEKQKIKGYGNYSEEIFNKVDKNLKRSNVISNGNYTICTELTGEGFSKYNNILINRFKETSDYKQGIFFYIKNLNQKTMWSNYPEINEKCTSIFAPDRITFSKIDGNITTTTKIIVVPENPVEIRRLELKNTGTEEEILEINNYFEPVLSTPMQDYSHMAFNNLFLTFEKTENNSILVRRRKRENHQKDIYLGVDLYTEAETIGEMEFEIDKEKFLGKGNLNLPDMIKNSKPYSRSLALVSEPILAIKKTIKVPPGGKIYLDLIICVSEDKEECKNLLELYRNSSLITKTFELNKAKTEAEIIYLGLKGEDIEIYQKILSYLIFQNPLKKVIDNIKEDIYMQSDLWKYGISGDLPILLVKIKDANDMHIIYDILKAQEFFKSKNVKVDLVILNQETNSYEHFIKHEIENAIQNKQLGYMKNKFGGIFILNESEMEEKDLMLLNLRANIIFDAGLGKLETQLKDMENEYINSIKNIGDDETAGYIKNNEPQVLDLKYEDLKYYNEYGGFSEDGLEYNLKISKEDKLPTVWSMILANKHFGTLVTQNLGGFTWDENSRLKRLTAWNNNPNMDVPSEIIYLKDKKTGETWTLSENLEKLSQNYYLSYGFGYVKLKTIRDEILHELEMFVAKEDKAKINILKLKNTSSERKNIKLLYYIKPVMGEDEIKTSGYIKVNKENNVVIAKNLYNSELESNILYVSSNENIKSYTGSKKSFIGEGNLNNPISLNKVSLDNSSGLRRNVLYCSRNRNKY